ncbi:alpha-glucan family phosphorylase [Micrococcoides hystricis]|uniref:glycogen phosphorylase n=1 Tax=Micrococcoides hystricis TaxID=1572761 RepID=A0ABV6PB12_9MICC
MKAIRRFTVRTHLPTELQGLSELAANLRWSWHLPTQRLFESLDPQGWAEVGGDPVALLSSFHRSQLAALAADPDIVQRTRELTEQLRTYLSEDRWYQQDVAGTEHAPERIAYFSPEYGITAVLPQYSGGLGILAGDHLKAASDLGVPIVGVGLLYQSGYFNQSLSRDAWQLENYPVLDPDNLPLTQLKEADGTAATVTLDLPSGRKLHADIWIAQVGRVPLLLLDSNVPANDDFARTITDRLYGGGGEHRLLQELLLGMGGVKALRTYARITGTPAPTVYHTNEGHAGFLGIERIEELLGRGLNWDQALAAVRASTLFTTHTPVPAGIDRFDRELIRHFFTGPLAPSVPVESLLELGTEDYVDGNPAVFNMAVMGLRLAQRANGVSQLHGNVSREMFSGLWPAFDTSEVPITSVTNGVHEPTWVAPEIVDFAAEALGMDAVIESDWSQVGKIPDNTLWDLKRVLRRKLITDARMRLRKSWLERGAGEAELSWIDEALDENVMTIGFARRVPTYKRLTLMLRDPERLAKLLTDPQRPIQLVIAGKSHPADEQGKRMIQELVQFTDDPRVRQRIVFLPNYDMRMAQTLFPGCDVWLNNPLRPLEACGTSGMKAALNGGLNLSILDGWWDEMYDGNNGWAIPTAAATATEDERDDLESAALYDLLENQLIPRFYGSEAPEATPGELTAQDSGALVPQDPVPHQWISMIKHTLQDLGPKVSASRMLKDYVQQLYLPAARSGAIFAADDFAAANQFAGYVEHLRQNFDAVSIEHVDSHGVEEAPQIGDTLTVQAYLHLGRLRPEEVQVQIIYGRCHVDDDALLDPQMHDLELAEDLDDGRFRYTGHVTLETSGSFGYTVRILPAHPLLASPAELGMVRLPAH